jgi:GH43 family beta-xylosidase
MLWFAQNMIGHFIRRIAEMDVYDATFDWHTIEGPCVVKHEGRYYCFYSGSNWQMPRYGVDFVIADNPLGPYSEGRDGPRVLHGIPSHVRGPGHHSIVFGPDGKTQYMVYHAWMQNEGAANVR